MRIIRGTIEKEDLSEPLWKNSKFTKIGLDPPPPVKHNIIPWKPPPFLKKSLELDPCMEDSCKCCSGVKRREVYTSLSKAN